MDIKKNTILLTFDVEDWFQVENFKEYIPYSSWESKELRVEKNTIELLDLLDAGPRQVKATFFVLGWIAERYPELILEIQKRGHEVASHGFDHHLCYNQTPEELREDLIKSKVLLEDLIGAEVAGYRAPSFSITDEAVRIVQDAGYRYDSSFNSYGAHGRYGSLTLPETEKQDLPLYALSPTFYEIPVSNLRVGKKSFPGVAVAISGCCPLSCTGQESNKSSGRTAATLFICIHGKLIRISQELKKPDLFFGFGIM